MGAGRMHGSDEESIQKIWSGNSKGREHSENLGVDRRIILELILKKEGMRLWTGCILIRIGTSGELF